MKCRMCGNEYQSEELNKSRVCEDCSVLSNWEKIGKIIGRYINSFIDRMSILTKRAKEAKFQKFFMVVLVIILAAIGVGVVIFILDLVGDTIFYILGVAAVSGVVYFLYENIVEVLVGLVVIFGGIIAKGLASSGVIHWYLSILIWGIIVGLIIAPFLVIVDVKKLKKTFNDDLESKENVRKEDGQK